ncbi:MAG: T9SS C-terminal target domain-containing protein [Chitinophagia bacterium]|nr:T9SS C-terminal target domain-containing protein [Chitinophagia bacterium]
MKKSLTTEKKGVTLWVKLNSMRKIYLYIYLFIALLGLEKAGAQSFSMEKDTVKLIYSGPGLNRLRDSIIVSASSSFGVSVRWYIKSCNFPSDWLATDPGICDNNSCYNFASSGSGLWPGRRSYTTANCLSTGGGASRDFHMQITLDNGTTHATTSGTYYCVAQMVNSGGSDSTTAVFAVTYNASSSVTNTVIKASDEVSLYPNPAHDEVNLVYDANANVKFISIYSIIGKQMATFRVNNTSANLSLDNMPSGIYFARLINAHGEVVATRKFTKQ